MKLLKIAFYQLITIFILTFISTSIFYMFYQENSEIVMLSIWIGSTSVLIFNLLISVFTTYCYYGHFGIKKKVFIITPINCIRLYILIRTYNIKNFSIESDKEIRNLIRDLYSVGIIENPNFVITPKLFWVMQNLKKSEK